MLLLLGFPSLVRNTCLHVGGGKRQEVQGFSSIRGMLSRGEAHMGPGGSRRWRLLDHRQNISKEGLG
jgi:hypothetical protein